MKKKQEKQESQNFQINKEQNNDLNFYSKLKLKQTEPKINTKKNVTWDDDNQLNNNMSLIIEEMMPNQSLNTNTNTNTNTDKMDILINKVDTLINLITILSKQLNK